MKKLTTTLTVLTLAGALTVTAAAVGVKSITAKLRPDITVKVNENIQSMTDDDDGALYPLSYEGEIYVPIDALEDALGYDVVWNSKDDTLTITAQGRQPGFSSVAGAETAAKTLNQEIRDLKSAASSAGRARQYALYSEKLELLVEDLDLVRAQVKEDYDMGRSTYATYRALIGRLNTVEDQARDMRTALAKKTIDLNDDDVPTTPTKPSGQSYSKQVDDLTKRVDTAVKNAYQYKPAKGASNNKQAFRQLESKLDALDEEIDRLDDVLERAYHTDALSAADYRSLENALDALDSKVDDASDYLDDILDRDYDDHDDDDDDDDDRWDDDDDDDDDRWDD